MNANIQTNIKKEKKYCSEGVEKLMEKAEHSKVERTKLDEKPCDKVRDDQEKSSNVHTKHENTNTDKKEDNVRMSGAKMRRLKVLMDSGMSKEVAVKAILEFDELPKTRRRKQPSKKRKGRSSKNKNANYQSITIDKSTIELTDYLKKRLRKLQDKGMSREERAKFLYNLRQKQFEKQEQALHPYKYYGPEYKDKYQSSNVSSGDQGSHFETRGNNVAMKTANMPDKILEDTKRSYFDSFNSSNLTSSFESRRFVPSDRSRFMDKQETNSNYKHSEYNETEGNNFRYGETERNMQYERNPYSSHGPISSSSIGSGDKFLPNSNDRQTYDKSFNDRQGPSNYRKSGYDWSESQGASHYVTHPQSDAGSSSYTCRTDAGHGSKDLHEMPYYKYVDFVKSNTGNVPAGGNIQNIPAEQSKNEYTLKSHLPHTSVSNSQNNLPYHLSSQYARNDYHSEQQHWKSCDPTVQQTSSSNWYEGREERPSTSTNMSNLRHNSNQSSAPFGFNSRADGREEKSEEYVDPSEYKIQSGEDQELWYEEIGPSENINLLEESDEDDDDDSEGEDFDLDFGRNIVDAQTSTKGPRWDRFQFNDHHLSPLNTGTPWQPRRRPSKNPLFRNLPGPTIKVAVLSSQYPTDKLSRKESKILQSTIMQAIESIPPDGPQVRFAHGKVLKKGFILLYCVDNETVGWLRQTVSKINMNGKTFITLYHNQVPKKTVFNVDIPSYGGVKLPVEAVLAKLKESNEELQVHEWKKLSVKNSYKGGQKFTFVVDPLSCRYLRIRKMKARFGFDTVVFELRIGKGKMKKIRAMMREHGQIESRRRF